MPIKKILIIPSNAQSYPFIKASGPDGDKTVEQYSGLHLQKLAKPLQKLLDAGHEVTFASLKGREPKSDSNSETLNVFAGNFYERQHEQDLVERMRRENGLSRPRPFSTISDNELTTFTGLFIPGGHAPLLNLDANAEIGRIMRYFHKENKPTAVICHGLFALLSTKQAGDRSFVYAGYKISSCSNTEKKAEELLWGGQVEKVESRLRDEGAIMVDSAPERTYGMTLHRELLTGCNLLAVNAFADQFLTMISNYGAS